MHMKKRIISLFAIACILVCTIIGATGCSTIDRTVVNIKSDISGGLQRTITVYTADGKKIANYEGKSILLQTTAVMLNLILMGKDIFITTALWKPLQT